MTNKPTHILKAGRGRRPHRFLQLRPTRWLSELDDRQADLERTNEDLVLRLTRAVLKMDPKCDSNDCGKRICARTKSCEKWVQDVQRYCGRDATGVSERTVEPVMLEMVRRYRAFQRTQIR